MTANDREPTTATAIDPSLADIPGSPLSAAERARVLSAVRLKLTLTVFVVAVLLGFSALTYVGVARIFDWLTPTIRHDLERKAQRGAIELAQTAQLGMVVSDPAAIASACADYVSDADVTRLIVKDAKGKTLFEHGKADRYVTQLFPRGPAQAHDLGEVYGAWAPSQIEAVEVGRVALVVSKARLEAGMQLRREILTAAAIVCVIALVFCLGFVTFYIGPILRVTGEAFERLERTTEAALQAARLKSQFLANMSHEIRTPMNGIIGVLDLLNRTALTARQQRYTQTIENSARGLLTIIDDILDFSKLEAGKYVLRESDFEVRQMAQEVVELLAPKAHAKEIEIVQRVDADVPYSVIGDVDRVKQVITNLIGNAIKFTDEGHVMLRISMGEPSGDRLTLRLSVEDTGVGIAADDQAKLFGMFSQVDGSMTRKHGGTGLGLAICKRLAEAMGGTIGVDSAPSRGSTFWFTVAVSPGNLAAPDDGVRPREARVLIVAKDEAQRETMCELIERWGMRYAVTDSPEQASTLIMDADLNPFDVAVVDGCFDETAQDSRTLFHLCTAEGLPLIRLLSTTQTASGRNEEAQQLCLVKPVRVSELYNGLVAMLDGVPIVQQRRGRAAADAGDGHAATRNGIVLVVDDNEINRLVAIELLAEIGYGTDVACNGVEAVEKATRGGYVAILMDCQMPEMDGYEATRRIRALPGAEARVPIIALTAHALAGDRDRVLQAGMDDYTAKPVRVRALERVLQRWVRPSSDAPATGDAGGAAAGVAAGGNGQPEAKPEELEVPNLELEIVLDPTIPRSPRVIELFLRAVPEQIEGLEQAARSDDAERFKPLAHKLKGSCLSLGASRMAAACAYLEQRAARGHVDRAMLAKLPELFAALAPLLAPTMRSGRPSDAPPARG